jgi:hypothetical protein
MLEGLADVLAEERMMATIAPAGNSISLTSARSSHVKPGAMVPVRRTRRLSREAGRAVEMLGHAIDYLTDEFALDCMSAGKGSLPGPNPRVAAIELLMASNREIYLSCPEVLPLPERLHSMLRSLLPSRTA